MNSRRSAPNLAGTLDDHVAKVNLVDEFASNTFYFVNLVDEFASNTFYFVFSDGE